jgi:hypothetical protein
MTWVLLIVMLKGDGLAAVPGYSSKQACESAGKEARVSMFNESKDSDGNLHSSWLYNYSCFPGPNRTK